MLFLEFNYSVSFNLFSSYKIKRIITIIYFNLSKGDNEKKMGLSPLSLMDRDKQHMIPQDQIQFINVICQPANELLAAIFPNCEALYTLAK